MRRQFVSFVHDSCKGKGLVVGSSALHSCVGILIFPVSLLQCGGYHPGLRGCHVGSIWGTGMQGSSTLLGGQVALDITMSTLHWSECNPGHASL